MKIGTLGHSNVTTGAISEEDIVIESNGVAFYGIISGLVADKVAYPIREIPTNAWDAARGDFDVHLPTSLNPIFRVRDRGQGMTPDQMINVFKRMYNSTKRDDLGQVGGWGIGRFSPLAYLLNEDGAGAYNVTSWTGGMARHYTVSVTAGGTPKFSELLAIESNEPSGMEISFAVRREDIHLFHDRAKRILWSFEPRPNVFPAINWEEPVIMATGDGWTRYKAGTVPFYGPHAKMGCVMYPIDLGNIETSGFVDSSDAIVFTGEIGSLEMTMSREDLQYSSKTKTNLKAMISAYESNYVLQVQEKITVAETYFKACEAFQAATANLGSTRQERLRRTIRWNGRTLATDIARTNMKVMKLGDGWRTFDKFSDMSCDTSWPSDAKVVIEHSPCYSFNRFEMAELVGTKVLWVRCKRFYRDQVISALGSPEVIDLDSFKVPLAKRSKTVRKRRTVSLGGYRSINRETQDIDMSEGGLYIDVASSAYGGRRSPVFDIADNARITASQLGDVLSGCTEMGILQAGATILVRTANEELPEGWTSLFDEICDPLKSKIDFSNVTAIGKKNINHLDSGLQTFEKLVLPVQTPEDLLELHTEVRALAVLLRANSDYTTTDTDKAKALLSTIGQSVTEPVLSCPIRPLEQRWVAAKRQYPLLGYIIDKGYYSRSTVLQDITHYFELLCRPEAPRAPAADTGNETTIAHPISSIEAMQLNEAA